MQIHDTPMLPTKAKKRSGFWYYVRKKKCLYIMLIPCILYFLIFNYLPMGGIIIAFKDFSFKKGIWDSAWCGLENFSYMFGLKDFYNVVGNSLILSLLRIVLTFPIPILLALMMNEINNAFYQKTIQTVIYLPHFISWVVVGSILTNFLSPSGGVINDLRQAMGLDSIFFMADKDYFRPLVILTSIWKESGWGTIIYLAAIVNVSNEIYEAARIDGASHFQMLRYITLPCIKSM
ncbi:MAG: ABC transporter permease subunit [Eubacteriales bacterium]|nr:ABC transporter permease subunit [Eubacteriales bacterium]